MNNTYYFMYPHILITPYNYKEFEINIRKLFLLKFKISNENNRNLKGFIYDSVIPSELEKYKSYINWNCLVFEGYVDNFNNSFMPFVGYDKQPNTYPIFKTSIRHIKIKKLLNE